MKNSTSKEYKLACIRDVIINSKGKSLGQKDLMDASGLSAVTLRKYIRELIAQGKVTMKLAPGAGKRRIYHYLEHTNPEMLMVRKLELPEYPIDPKAVDSLGGLLLQWIDSSYGIGISGDMIQGASMFRRYIVDETKRVKAKRDQILTEHEKSQ